MLRPTSAVRPQNALPVEIKMCVPGRGLLHRCFGWLSTSCRQSKAELTAWSDSHEEAQCLSSDFTELWMQFCVHTPPSATLILQGTEQEQRKEQAFTRLAFTSLAGARSAKGKTVQQSHRLITGAFCSTGVVQSRTNINSFPLSDTPASELTLSTTWYWCGAH